MCFGFDARFFVALSLDPPAILLKSRKQTITSPLNVPVSLKCPAEGNPTPTFSWYRSAQRARSINIKMSIESVLEIVPREDSDFTLYTCKVSNSIGSDTVEYILRQKG